MSTPTTAEPLAGIEITGGGMYLHLDSLTLSMLPADSDDAGEVRATLVDVEKALMLLDADIPAALNAVRNELAQLDAQDPEAAA